ncbi:MAG: hypothetical protein ACRDSZ_18485 [Pseudonocardiaceae bacterium]
MIIIGYLTALGFVAAASTAALGPLMSVPSKSWWLAIAAISAFLSLASSYLLIKAYFYRNDLLARAQGIWMDLTTIGSVIAYDAMDDREELTTLEALIESAQLHRDVLLASHDKGLAFELNDAVYSAYASSRGLPPRLSTGDAE